MLNPEDKYAEQALPDEARAALRRGGERLFAQLDSMRQSEAARVEIEPLDSRAELALRRQGDDLLDRLAELRLQAGGLPSRTRWWRSRRLGIAVAVVGLVGIAFLAGNAALSPRSGKGQPETVAIGPMQTPGDLVDSSPPSPAIPEPGSGLLTILGATMLLARRRRPASSAVPTPS